MPTLSALFRWTLLLAVCSFCCPPRPAAAAAPLKELQAADLKALQRGIEDLAATFGDRYPRGKEFLKQAVRLEKEQTAIEAAIEKKEKAAAKRAAPLAAKIEALRHEALLANPLLDFDKLLLVRRREAATRPAAKLAGQLLDPRVAATTTRSPCSRRSGRAARSRRSSSPKRRAFVGDVDLHFDAAKMLFSMPNDQRPLAGL